MFGAGNHWILDESGRSEMSSSAARGGPENRSIIMLLCCLILALMSGAGNRWLLNDEEIRDELCCGPRWSSKSLDSSVVLTTVIGLLFFMFCDRWQWSG